MFTPHIISNSNSEEKMSFQIPIKKEYCCVSDRFITFNRLPFINLISSIDITKDIHFEVCFPDGRTFNIEDEDTQPPQYPRFELQVSAEFLIKSQSNE